MTITTLIHPGLAGLGKITGRIMAAGQMKFAGPDDFAGLGKAAGLEGAAGLGKLVGLGKAAVHVNLVQYLFKYKSLQAFSF